MTNEKRLISLDDALAATHKEVFWTESKAADVRAFLIQQPKVDAVEVVHSEWEQGDFYDYGDVCSVCDWDSEINNCKWSYCPNCGAKMDGKRRYNHE